MNYAELIQAWCRLLRAAPADIGVLLMRGPYQYKHYQIEKRTGGKRDIYHPSPNLKAVQRWLVSEHFSKLPVHDSVYSYRIGRGIRDHAKLHIHSNFLLRLDFKDFFPSINHDWVLRFLLDCSERGVLSLDARAIAAVMRVVCRFSKFDRSLALSIGAPSSPALSNTILFEADQAASARCAALDCVYSRYADDIYVSCRDKEVLGQAERQVRDVFHQTAPSLRFNEDKTLNVSKKARRVVTGLTITPDRSISVGRELKRSIKTQVYLYIEGSLPREDVPHLCGLVSYVRDVEPAFFDALTRKFGPEQLENLYRNEPGTALRSTGTSRLNGSNRKD